MFFLYGGVDDHDEVDDDHTMVQMILWFKDDDHSKKDQVISCSQELLWGDHAGLLKSADNYQKPDTWKTNWVDTIY